MLEQKKKRTLDVRLYILSMERYLQFIKKYNRTLNSLYFSPIFSPNFIKGALGFSLLIYSLKALYDETLINVLENEADIQKDLELRKLMRQNQNALHPPIIQPRVTHTEH